MTETKPKSKKPDPSTKKVLVVDDEDSIREMIKVTLTVEGFQVKATRDGNSGIKAAQDYKPNLIVSDVMMPNGGGYELLRMLQAEETTRSIPVIMISGKNFDASTKDMMLQESNVSAFMEKPLRPQNFLKKIHEILNTISREEKMKLGQNQDLNQAEIQKRFDGLF